MFLIVNSPDSFDSSILTNMKIVYDKIDNKNRCTRVFHHAKAKPVDDSFIELTDTSFFLFEGVVVNDNEMVNKYAVSDLNTLLKNALQDDPMTITKELNGPFCGLYIDIEHKLIKAFTDQISSGRVFYYNKDDIFIVSTSIKQIIRLLKANNLKISIDELGAMMLLTFGFMLADYTTISEIRHLRAGQCISLQDGLVSIRSYHRYNNVPKYNDLNKSVHILQELFSKSVKMSFDKDLANGRKHIAFLSGGLDSRRVVMTAHKLGYRDVSCLNYSDPGCDDELIARKVAKLLDYRLLFYSLENGSYLMNLENCLKYNEGQILLHGAAHLNAAISSIDLSPFGLIHSGQIGDSILGTFVKTNEHVKVNLASGGFSTKLFDTLYPHIKHMENEYENNEMYVHYNRDFNAEIHGDLACAQYSYSISPFTEPEFLQFCLNNSPALRSHNLLYHAWIKRSNPLGASIKWERTGLNLYAPKSLLLTQRILRIAERRLRKLIFHKENLTGMNPFDKWWLQNPALREKYSKMSPSQEEIRGQVSSELWNCIETMFHSNLTTEKLQAYSLLAGLSYLLSDDD